MTFPSSALQLCPDTLPTTEITEDEWYGLDLEGQIQLMTRHAQNFALGYFKCAILHNTGVEAYNDNVKARDEWIASRDADKEEEKETGSRWNPFD